MPWTATWLYYFEEWLSADADQAWGVTRNTMKDEFRVAAKHNEAMQEVLKDPGFRDAFTGNPGEEPAQEILSALADKAVDDAVKAMSTVEIYSKFTGPTVRAAVFLREATYNAMKSILSTTHVLAENDAAGKLLKVSGALEKRYKDTIDSLRSCRAGKQ